MLNTRILFIFRLLTIVTGVAFVSCSMHKSPQAAPLKQGIDGFIYLATGNQMPMVGQPRNQPKGIPADVYIYKATSAQQATGNTPIFTQINSELVAHVKSDTTGHYQAALPAGQYSVLVKHKGSYFSSESNDKGILTPADVTTGMVTHRNVTVNVGAAY
jgi:hypothetical protein